MIRGWDLILPGCSETSTLARRATLSARWLHQFQPVSNQREWCCGFHTVRGGIDPRDLRSRPRVAGVLKIWKDLESGDGTLSFPGATRPQRWPDGQRNSRRALAPRASANQQPASGVRVSTSCGAVLNRGISVFVPGVVEVVDIWKES